MSSLPMFDKQESNTVAYRIGSSAVNLPSGHNIQKQEIEYICKVINKITKK